MRIKKIVIKNLIELLGFKAQEGEKDISLRATQAITAMC